MRIVILCKRRPQGRDLFTQPYGRFYHLPRLLAERGHEVHLLLLGYRREPSVSRQAGNLHLYASPALPWGPLRYLDEARRLAARVRPDWVLGCSDTWYGIAAERLARRCGARSLIDAYDNYESYIPWLRPLHLLWRRALRKSDAVTAAGPQLAALMSESAGGRHVAVVPMAADPNFVPMDKQACRQRLGLPRDGILVGYAGALHRSRGLDLLFDAYRRLHVVEPRAQLVLSGRLGRGVDLPEDVHWLGCRPDEEVPAIFNSLDLLFVINRPSAFGKYSYPVKLYEALACGVPVVAVDVPGTAWVLRDRPEVLVDPGDASGLAQKAVSQIATGPRPGRGPGWEASADLLEALLRS